MTLTLTNPRAEDETRAVLGGADTAAACSDGALGKGQGKGKWGDGAYGEG